MERGFLEQVISDAFHLILESVIIWQILRLLSLLFVYVTKRKPLMREARR
jgi:hypothetical protein